MRITHKSHFDFQMGQLLHICANCCYWPGVGGGTCGWAAWSCRCGRRIRTCVGRAPWGSGLPCCPSRVPAAACATGTCVRTRNTGTAAPAAPAPRRRPRGRPSPAPPPWTPSRRSAAAEPPPAAEPARSACSRAPTTPRPHPPPTRSLQQYQINYLLVKFWAPFG